VPAGLFSAVQFSACRGRLAGNVGSAHAGTHQYRPKGVTVAKPAPTKSRKKTPAKVAAVSSKTPRGLTRDQLIAELNKDLAKEFSALIQYVQHAAVITGPQYDAITAELVVHSNEEHAHAISLSDQIDFLGGIPAVDVGDIHISPDSKIMLELDLEGELDAIARYKERVAQAEMLQEYGLRRALEDILIVEEEHARDLQSALDL
jgi:bacterioferritin